MGLSRQEYWSGLTFSSPGKLPNLGIELGSPAFQTLQTDSLPDEQSGKPKLQLKIRKKSIIKVIKSLNNNVARRHDSFL